jgi:hypothetical protein
MTVHQVVQLPVVIQMLLHIAHYHAVEIAHATLDIYSTMANVSNLMNVVVLMMKDTITHLAANGKSMIVLKCVLAKLITPYLV